MLSYNHNACKSSLVGLGLYVVLKCIWAISYFGAKRPRPDEAHWSAGRERAAITQGTSLLVSALVLLACSRQYRKGTAVRRSLLCLPILFEVLAIVSHAEAFRLFLDVRAGYKVSVGDFASFGLKNDCWDSNTFNTLMFAIVWHFVAVLPAVCSIALILPLSLISFVPVFVTCRTFLDDPRLLTVEEYFFSIHSRSPIYLVAFMVALTISNCFKAKAQWELAKHVTLHHQSAIQEKVKRCAAEFETEQVREQAKTSQQTKKQEQASICEKTVVSSVPSAFTTRTAQTSPTVLLSWRDSKYRDMACMNCATGDCLPEHYRVQAIGSAELVELCKLQVGSKVLCYDNVLKGTAHIEVTEVEVSDPKGDREADEWITVQLSDGTSLDMTGDHPVFAQRHGNMVVDAILAKDLLPGEHSLTSTRIVQLGVKNVRKWKDCSERRVRFCVKNNERYAVFVSSTPGLPQGTGFVAVGSSDVDELMMSKARNFWSPLTEERPLRRCQSSPACLTEAVALSPLDQPSQLRGEGDEASENTSLMYTNTTRSEGPTDADFHLVGKSDQPQSVSLRELREIEAAGIPSIGSIPHGNGCRPCEFYHRHRRWTPSSTKLGRPPDCVHGRLCAFCHHDHVEFDPYPKNRKDQKKSIPL
eukprot:TRINITY_DN27089_c0_g1_i6.p1 TRINITY_DN27089_c0_g1~~TRINITY_DN27089_c0_g1_i6.p1  ORF type:complete len:710 (+),score=70.58 TRINITY_DN27089_c0_g1_i6:203-2131(+)